MAELKDMLEKIEDSYIDFVEAICHYAQKNSTRLNMVLEYLKNNPKAHSSDVVRFVSEQPDFAEDASYMQFG